MKNKNTKLVKWSKTITQQPKPIKNPNIIDIKSATIKNAKSSCKLSRAKRQAKKLSQVTSAGKNFIGLSLSETK